MGRWEPNASQRLTEAAVELFIERGYETVTVAQIAERAGLTKRTFFRHFTDKREILFGGQESYRLMFAEAIAGAPDSATPLEAVGAAVRAFAAGIEPERRDAMTKRQAIIADNPDLQERELLKRAALTAAIVDALHARGVDEPTASLAAHVGALALDAALRGWLAPSNRKTLGALAGQELRKLCKAVGALS